MGVSCSKDYPDIIDDVCRIVSSIGLHPKVRDKTDKRIKNPNGSIKIGRGINVGFSSTPLRRFMDYIGVHGRNGKNFAIPKVILESPKSVIREFIRGLFESDGHVVKDCCAITFCTLSQELASQVQFVLLLFGIKSRISKKKMKLKSWTEGRSYFYVTLGSKSSRIFSKEIGFISDKKSNLLRTNSEKKKSNKFRDWNMTEEIVSIEHVTCDVFDISVPEVKSYIANGFNSHNSSLKVLEYQAIGIMPVASDTVTYRSAIHRGLLAKNGTSDWYFKMRNAINMDAERAEAIDANKKFVNREYNVKDTALEWIAMFRNVLESKQ